MRRECGEIRFGYSIEEYRLLTVGQFAILLEERCGVDGKALEMMHQRIRGFLLDEPVYSGFSAGEVKHNKKPVTVFESLLKNMGVPVSKSGSFIQKTMWEVALETDIPLEIIDCFNKKIEDTLETVVFFEV